MLAVHEERVALVGLPPDSLDIIRLVRESGRAEVRLLADPDPLSPAHSLAAVFRVPSTPELADVERSGCGTVVVPDGGMGSGDWVSRWAGAGVRCLTLTEAERFFAAGVGVPSADAGRELEAAAAPEPAAGAGEARGEEAGIQPSPPLAHQIQDTPLFDSHPRAHLPAASEPPITGEPHTMLHTAADPEIRAASEALPVPFPASLRASATHLEQFLAEQRSAFDAARGFAMIWDDVLGDLVPAREVLEGEAGPDQLGDWAMQWVRRAWTERRALIFQESALTPSHDTPHRARAFVALPLGDEGILYLEDAWLPLDPQAREREDLAQAARRWAEELAASRAEQRALLRQRIHDRLGRVVFDLLPETENADPWPSTAAALAELLDADAVVFHFHDGGVVSSAGLDPAHPRGLAPLIAGRTAESLRALPLLAARARGAEGLALRRAGVASCLSWARGDDMNRVAVAAFRFSGATADEFDPEHLSALKKLLGLAHALSRASA